MINVTDHDILCVIAETLDANGCISQYPSVSRNELKVRRHPELVNKDYLFEETENSHDLFLIRYDAGIITVGLNWNVFPHDDPGTFIIEDPTMLDGILDFIKNSWKPGDPWS